MFYSGGVAVKMVCPMSRPYDTYLTGLSQKAAPNRLRRPDR